MIIERLSSYLKGLFDFAGIEILLHILKICSIIIIVPFYINNTFIHSLMDSFKTQFSRAGSFHAKKLYLS